MKIMGYEATPYLISFVQSVGVDLGLGKLHLACLQLLPTSLEFTLGTFELLFQAFFNS